MTGLGIAGPHTNLLGGIGKGLKNLPGLGGNKPSSTPDVPAAPVPLPVSKSLAGLVTANGMRSESDVVVGKNSITSYAHTHASEIKLLGGLLDHRRHGHHAKTVSDGKKATTTGHATVGALKIGGQTLGLDEKGLNIAGTSVEAAEAADRRRARAEAARHRGALPADDAHGAGRHRLARQPGHGDLRSTPRR